MRRRAGVAALLAASLQGFAAPVSAEDAATLPPISVVATRSSLAASDPSASLRTLDAEELSRSPARTLDDALRSIPGFSLFRRLGSGAAHPTTQGVSLRGLGPSGTSRALVLVDGIPVNDPFGGWVAWNRIPSETIEKVEVLRGSGAGLWGNFAMGGVIHVTTRSPDRNAGGFVAEGGERGGGRTEGWTSRRFGATSALLDGRWMRSGDYPLVREDSRGSVDIPGGSEHGSGGIALQQRLAPGASLRLSARGFHDNRDNGTAYTKNETSAGYFRAGLDIGSAERGTLSADVFGSTQTFSSTFSSVAAGRGRELPAADQYSVPSSSAGASLVWSREAMRVHRFVAGVDALWVEGKSRELARFVDGAFTRRREGGAEQTMEGIFVGDTVRATPRVDVTGALRVDHWQSSGGFRRETDLVASALLADRDLEDRSDTFVSPRLGVAWAATDQLVLRSAMYRGFREPTINEQVRPFRVRNDITEANAALSAEKLFGVEGGFDHQRGPWHSAATLFWNELRDPVFNVTVGNGGGTVPPCGFVPDGGVCRQRRNLGSSRVLGIEAETGVELGRGFSTTLAWLWSDGRIHSADDDPTLVGNRIPQVPKHQGTIAFAHDDGGPWRASLQLRLVGRQYEDDANTRTLGSFVAVDAFVARSLGAGFEVFVAAENLFDKTIASGVGADGVVTIAAPRLVRAGLRYSFGTGADGAPDGDRSR